MNTRQMIISADIATTLIDSGITSDILVATVEAIRCVGESIRGGGRPFAYSNLDIKLTGLLVAKMQHDMGNVKSSYKMVKRLNKEFN